MNRPPLGIDVSHANGRINWGTIARSGRIAFAYAKASEGDTRVDPLFAENRTGIRQVGLLRGAYHFFHPARPVAQQAGLFLSAVKEPEPGDLPPMLDLEETSREHDEWPEIEPERRAPLVLEWLERIEQTLGRKPIIYTRRNFVEDIFGRAEALAAYPVWIAHYTAGPAPSVPASWSKWTLWQFTDHGRAEGVVSNLDMNRFNGSLSDLQTLAGLRSSPVFVPAERQ
jgi:lysozyme